MSYQLPEELTVSGEHKAEKYPPSCPVCGSDRYSSINFLPHKMLNHEPGCPNHDFQPKPPQWKVWKLGQWLKDYLGLF